MTTLPELLAEASRLSAELEKTIPQLTECVRVSAETENKYRKAKSTAYVTARTMDELKFANERTTWQFNITNLKSDNLDFLVLALGQTGHFLVIPRDILVNKNILAYMLPADKIINRPNSLDTYLDAWHLLLSASKQ